MRAEGALGSGGTGLCKRNRANQTEWGRLLQVEGWPGSVQVGQGPGGPERGRAWPCSTQTTSLGTWGQNSGSPSALGRVPGAFSAQE